MTLIEFSKVKMEGQMKPKTDKVLSLNRFCVFKHKVTTNLGCINAESTSLIIQDKIVAKMEMKNQIY